MNKQYFEKPLVINGKEDKNIKLKYVKLIPDANKCLKNKKTGHKFVHTIKHTGLTLEVPKQYEDLYEEVSI